MMRTPIWPRGTWVICVGYQKQELGYVFYFNDPACVGYCMMSEQDLNNRWIDMDTEGNVYDHYGIEITADGTSYNPDGDVLSGIGSIFNMKPSSKAVMIGCISFLFSYMEIFYSVDLLGH